MTGTRSGTRTDLSIATYQSDQQCIFLGYGESGEMGFGLWDPEAKKIVCSHSVLFDKKKVHTKPINTVEIKRVFFQEDEQVQDVQVGGKAPQPQGHEEEVKEEGHEVSQPIPRWSTRVSRLLHHYVPSLEYVMVTNYKEPSC